MSLHVPSTTMRPPFRCNFSFSPSGNHAVCLASEEDGYAVELWILRVGGGASIHRLGSFTDSPFGLQPRVDDDGKVLLARSGESDCQELVWFAPGHVSTNAPLRSTVAASGLNLPTAGLAIGYSEGSLIVWAAECDQGLRKVAALEGGISGGIPLDSLNRYFGFNHRTEENEVKPICIDIETGAVSDLAPGQVDVQLMLSQPRTGDLLFAIDISTEPRLATASWDSSTLTVGDLDIPVALNDTQGSVRPLVFDDTGKSLVLAATRGVRTHLIRHDLNSDRGHELPLPLGVVAGPAIWADGGPRFPFSAPTIPYAVVTVPDDARCEGDLQIALPPESSAVAPSPGWLPAVVERHDLDECSVEMMVYGEDWRTAPRVLIALHGGPESAWKAEFDPLLQELAAAGITVVAPNQRGSTGYGPDHQEAIVDAWGGPDLADICRLADYVSSQRTIGRGEDVIDKLMLFGISYGAYLALLAAAARPDMWSHCVAESPFLSGARLYDDATPPVRRLLDRLGGCTHLDDETGRRDLAVLAKNICAQVMIIHGVNDTTIPVSHARELSNHLSASVNCPSPRYLEVVNAGHSPLTDTGGPRLMADMIGFLTDR
jgi:pimeloyl-ACP methyl ester carboxylesterase